MNSLLDTPTKLAAQGLLPIRVHGVVLSKGHFPNQGTIGAALGAIERLITGEKKLPERTEEGRKAIERMGKFVINKLLLDISPRPRMSVDTYQEARRLLSSKPAAFVDQLLQKAESVKAGLDRHKEGGFFAKAEDVFKETAGLATQVQEGRCRIRGIYTMGEEEYCLLYHLLGLFEIFLEGETVSKWHIKHKTPEEIGRIFVDIVNTDTSANTDFSAFESSLGKDFQKLEEFLMVNLASKCGYQELIPGIRKYMGRGRKYKNRCLAFEHLWRVSGVFWTAFMNLICNIIVIACSHWSVSRWKGDLEKWWKEFCGECRMAEGDDALTLSRSMNPAFIAELGFKFSLAHLADQPQDINILKTSYLASGLGLRCPLRIMASLAVRTTQPLKLSKLKFLLRMGALGLAHSNKGLPIIMHLVKRIRKMTAGVNAFSGWQSYLADWTHTTHDEEDGWPSLDTSQDLRVMMSVTKDPTLTRVSLEQQFAQEKLIDEWCPGGYLHIVPELESSGSFASMFYGPTVVGQETGQAEAPNVRDWLVALGAIPGRKYLVKVYATKCPLESRL